MLSEKYMWNLSDTLKSVIDLKMDVFHMTDITLGEHEIQGKMASKFSINKKKCGEGFIDQKDLQKPKL